MREYYIRNKEHILEKQSKYYISNKERIKNYMRLYMKTYKIRKNKLNKTINEKSQVIDKTQSDEVSTITNE